MVSNFPSPIDVPNQATSRPEPAVEGLGERMMDRVREVFCGLHGHDTLLQFQHERMFLKCVSCGHESPGWELDEAPPIPFERADTRRQRPIATSRPVNERRIA